MRALLSPLIVCLVSSELLGSIRITEIMYNPVNGEDREFVELTNTGAAPVDLDGWLFAEGILFAFPESTILDPGAFVVVCASKEVLLGLYPDLPAETLVFGDYAGGLANGGERLTLLDASGTIQDSLRYDDNPPWDFLADGFGTSLERLCLEENADQPENWRASPLPAEPESEPGGTPGLPAFVALCPPELPARPPVFLSEILYHAVLEEAIVEEYEFIEIHNSGAESVQLDGWRLAAGIDYAFPVGTALEGGGYLVIAKDPVKLAAAWSLNAGDLLGPFDRSLDNGGEKVALLGAEGQGIDSVNYDDGFPWPVAADALGGGRTWLPEEFLPLEDHQFKGRSLERVSFEEPSGLVANWEASPLDGATPGRPNASARGMLLPVVEDIDVSSLASGAELIRDMEEVLIEIQFSPRPPLSASLEYYVEDIEASDEESLRLPLMESDGLFTLVLPALPENSIVRYRVHAERGAGEERISPRPTHPNPWHAYFVSPVIETTTRTYHMFIARRDWGQLGTNIAPNRVSGCNMNPRWNARVPAVFVHEGRVIDAQVRFQGSRWNRGNGPGVSPWPYPGPSPGSPRALSWRIALPRYRQLEGRRVVVLNKLVQGCPGHNSGVGYRLFAMADLPSPETRYARFHINGGYFHYMMEYERPGEEMIRRYNREMAAKYPDRPPEQVGHLFKSVGCTCDEGPFGWGDWRLLNSFCGHTKEVRYAHTYDRKTHDWAGPDDLVKLIEDMHAARAEGTEAMRAYVLENFDLELLLSYIAIINYQVPFDDMFQNHFIYQRTSDGKWLLAPWDLDRNFGEWQGANSSLYMGMSGDPSNRKGNGQNWWHRLKDTALRAFREEYENHLLLLNNTLLHPDTVVPMISQVTAESNLDEARSSPAIEKCTSFSSKEVSFRSFVTQRHALINSQLAGVSVDAGIDRTVFAGAEVLLDGSASQPEPSAEVVYTWSTGDEGNMATVVFEEPGTHEITLTVTTRGVPFRDIVTVTVIQEPHEAFVENNGLVVLEAESHFMNIRNGEEDAWWAQRADLPGYSGNGYMLADSTRRRSFTTNYTQRAPELRYAVRFDTPGTYRVWLRALAEATRSDSVNISIDGLGRSSTDAQEFIVDEGSFLWSGLKRNDDPQEIVIEKPGLRIVSVWIRESGLLLDKIVLSSVEAFVPEDMGPEETARVALDGTPTFLRGDPDVDGRVTIIDTIAILVHLFEGTPVIACEDRADVNDSGTVDLTDAIGLATFLIQRGTPPALPFPEHGFDPTPDDLRCER